MERRLRHTLPALLARALWGLVVLLKAFAKNRQMVLLQGNNLLWQQLLVPEQLHLAHLAVSWLKNSDGQILTPFLLVAELKPPWLAQRKKVLSVRL